MGAVCAYIAELKQEMASAHVGKEADLPAFRNCIMLGSINVLMELDARSKLKSKVSELSECCAPSCAGYLCTQLY